MYMYNTLTGLYVSMWCSSTMYFVQGDAGLTGRKIIVDTWRMGSTWRYVTNPDGRSCMSELSIIYMVIEEWSLATSSLVGYM